MNPKSLEALIVDCSLGELPLEAIELLDAYLELHPEAKAEAKKIEETLAISRQAVSARPKLFSEAALDEERDKEEKIVPLQTSAWMRAAAAIALLTLVGLAGYLAGNRDSGDHESESLLSNATDSPWARYRITDSGIEASIPTPSPEP